MTAVLENPPATPADPADHPVVPEQVVTLTAAQVAQHPDNIRDPGRDLDALAQSIHEVGVLVPLIVVPADQIPGEWPDGITHVAVDGNRRQAAAAAVAAALPCLVRPDLADAQATARTMAVTGLLRDGLTVIEEARAVQTMLDLGLSQTAISKATGRSRDYVRKARTAATITADTATQAARYALSLDQLADLAEFDGDDDTDEDTIKTLMYAAADPGEWAHAIEQARQECTRAAALASKRAEFEAAGVAVVEWIDYRNRVEALTHDGEPITDHTGCPGVEVSIRHDWNGDLMLIEGCADPAAHGHGSRYGEPSFGKPDRTAETPEQAETRKTERRELVRLNKVADAAQEVRRRFCRDLLATKNKTATAQMTGWAIDQILTRDRAVTGWLADHSISSAPPLADIIGGEEPIATATTAPVTRRPLMLWAYAVAAHEFDFPRDAHRNRAINRAGYLRHLVDLGYTPAETDRLVMADDNTSAD